METSLIDKIVALANADDQIRAVILEGSLAAGFQVDELSDYDVNIFARSCDNYLDDDRWMEAIGAVLLYQKEEFQFYEAVVPTRLVLFRNRQRVDFSFWTIDLLADLVRGYKVYESYQVGYRVLVDKDSLAGQLKPPTGVGFVISPPERDEFLQTIYDFWFEAYCVAKYLSRLDIWFAKLIENRYIKDHLFRMVLWDHQADRSWQPDPILHTEGKRFESWASPQLVEQISRCFSVYDAGATWESLSAMVSLFNRLARKVASQLHIPYPQQVERDLLSYLAFLKDRTVDPDTQESEQLFKHEE